MREILLIVCVCLVGCQSYERRAAEEKCRVERLQCMAEVDKVMFFGGWHTCIGWVWYETFDAPTLIYK